MNFAQPIDFAPLMEPVANRLLGEPNLRLSKPPLDVRFGIRGSISVDFVNGRWYDHETEMGGGVLDLISHKTGRNRGEAQAWLKREGLFNAPPSAAPRPAAPIRQLGEIVATYDYVDEHGNPLFQVVRFDPKDFRQRRAARSDDDPAKVKNGWVWEVKDTRQVPYHLPDLIKGVAAGRRIFITEGEKDADNLRSLGFVATTNPGGAKKWRQDFSAFFTGSNVVVVADNDEAGRLHVDEIAASLHGIAAEVRVLDIKAYWPECGPKGDISDWIAASANDPDDFAGKLKEAVKALVPWTPPSNNGGSTAAATIDSSSAGQRGAAMSGSWPDPKPLPCGLPPVDDFSSDFMPSALAPWVDDIATRLQCPPDYVAVAAITALGSTIGRRLGIKPQTDWVEIPNLWGAFIGRPGMLKSPAMNEALRPLYHLEHEAAEANDLARQTYAADLEAYKIRQQVRISQAKDALRKDPSGSVDGLTIGDEPQEPPNVRYRTNDSSYESLGELQISNPNGILVERDELISLLKSLERDDQTVLFRVSV
jgi:hypothetical protein